MFYKSMKKNRKMEHLKMFSTFGRRWLWISMNMLIWMIVVLPNVYGQQSEKLISLNVNQVSVLEAIQQINLLSDNSISYKREELEKEVKKVTLNLTDVKVLTAVRAVLNGSRLEAMVHGEVIFIVPQKDARTSMQMINVKGVVTDKNKIPMPGVTVKLVGASIGTATNVKGFFSLQLPAQNGMLEFSFVGYKSRKIDFATNMRDTIRVVLEEDIQSMDEVIVTGYQNIDKRMNTSAVQTLKMDEIRVAGVQTVDQLLESRVPGMIFMQNSGQVGATPKIRVRGTSTVLGNQEPVWVLDGIVLHDPVNVNASLANSLDFVNLVGNAISGINPEDIERIDILKDASATALYGAKAANGVIVITTKKGKVGTPALSYSMSGTFTARPRYTDKSIYLMNSKERIAYSREIMEKGLSYPSITNWVGYEGVLNDFYQGNITGEQMLQEIDRLETVNTDWFDLMMRDAFSHSHTLSLSGGTDNIRYYASLGYSDEVGVIRKEGNKRYTTNMNINGTFNKFSFQFSLTANKGERNYANSEIDILNYAYYTSRAIPAYNEDGTLFYYNREGGPGSTKVGLAFNALNEMNNCRDEYTNSGITLTSNLNYSLNESLKGQFIFSYAINNNLQESFLLANTWYAANLRGTNYGEEMLLATKAFSKMPYGGEYRQTTTRNESYTTRLQLDFNKFLDKDQKHLINAAIGFEASSSTYKGLQRTARGYIPERGKMFVSVDYNQFPAYAEWALTNETAKGIMTDNVTNELSGYFTLSYTYNNAYTVNFNTRADASNKFGSRSNEKLLPVWSVSGTWDMKANLLKNVHWIDVLSPRASFGYQGNMLDSQTPELIIKKGDMNEYFEEYMSTIAHYPNPNLRWEKTGTLNVSLDFSLFQNRLRGTVSYFYKKTKDAFLSKQVSDINGRDEYVINSGTIENKGFELSFNFTPIKSSGEIGAFRWDIDPQLGQVVNNLLTKAVNGNNFEKTENEIFYTDYLNGTALVKGKPLNTFYSYCFDGLSPEDGRPMFKGINKDEVAEKYLKMDREQVYMEVMRHSGTRVPVIQGGISNTFSYKHFSLNVYLGYSIGSKIRLLKLYGNQNSSTIAPLPENNVRREFVHRWQRPGDEKHTNIPGLLPNNSYHETIGYGLWWNGNDYASIRFADNLWQMYDNSDLRVVSGNYLKLQSFSFNYSLSEKLCQKMHMKAASIGLTGHNVHTWCNSKLKGQDPSQSGSSDKLNLSLRPSYSISLRVSF